MVESIIMEKEDNDMLWCK